MSIQLDFSKFSIEDIERWAEGTAGLEIDADNSQVVVAQ